MKQIPFTHTLIDSVAGGPVDLLSPPSAIHKTHKGQNLLTRRSIRIVSQKTYNTRTRIRNEKKN